MRVARAAGVFCTAGQRTHRCSSVGRYRHQRAPCNPPQANLRGAGPAQTGSALCGGSAAMECKMIAVVQPTEGVAVAVDNTFKTINFVRKRALLVDEIRLSSPASPGVQGQSLLLVHEADAAAGGDAATVWTARHEGPQRQNEKKLAAYSNVTCRPVMAAQCMGTRAEVLQFWHALGFSTVYEITKTGNEYWCQSLGVDVRVQYTQLTTGRDAEVSAAVAAGLKQTLLVEVSAPATDRDFVHVCRALSEFAEGLKPLVQLTNASVSAHLWKLNKKV